MKFWICQILWLIPFIVASKQRWIILCLSCPTSHSPNEYYGVVRKKGEFPDKGGCFVLGDAVSIFNPLTSPTLSTQIGLLPTNKHIHTPEPSNYTPPRFVIDNDEAVFYLLYKYRIAFIFSLPRSVLIRRPRRRQRRMPSLRSTRSSPRHRRNHKDGLHLRAGAVKLLWKWK